MSCRKELYADLDKYRETRRKQKQRYRDRNGGNIYEPRRWSTDEDEMVLKHCIPDREISVILQMSIQAVQNRIHNLKWGKC